MPETPRGIPLYTTADPAKLDILLNGHANAMDFAITEAEQDTQDGESAPTVDDLPETGNWLGRTVYVEEDGTFRICIGLPNTWHIAYRVPVEGTVDWNPGWSAEPGHKIERDADHVTLNFNAGKTSAVVTEDIVGYLPEGFRPDAIVVTSASYHGTGAPGPATVTITTEGEVRVWFSPPITQTKLAFTTTFPI